MPEPRVPTSAWWAPATWEAAQAAYTRDKDAGGPATFIGWVHAAIEAHAARGAAGRTALQIPERPVLSDQEGRPRAHPLRLSTRELLDRARAEDERTERSLSVSAWIYEAVAAAIRASDSGAEH